MATAKKTTSTAVAVKKPTGVVSVKEQLAAQLAALAGKTAPVTGNMIRITQDKKFKLPDGTVIDGAREDGVLNVVVVDFVSVNKYYEGAYDPNSVTPPSCFAIDSSPLKMVPSGNSPDKQAPSCNECPMNQFGSAGNGKACKNTRLLAVLPPDADESTPLWLLAVSPTAIRAWDGYVGSVARTFGTAPLGVVTEVSMDPASTYPSLRFGDPQPNEQVGTHLARLEEAQQMLVAEPDVSQYQAAPPPPARGRAAAPARGRAAATARR